MTTFKVGYLIGSFAREPINRKLAKPPSRQAAERPAAFAFPLHFYAFHGWDRLGGMGFRGPAEALTRHGAPIRYAQEVELKLEVEPLDLDKVLAHPLLQGSSGDTPQKQDLHSTYFDTPDHALKQAGISLWIRRNGTRRIQTVKAAQSQKDVALTRDEWEHDVDGDEPDFSSAGNTALKPFVALHDAIRPVFSVTAERTLREIPYGVSIIEVAADRGKVDGQARPLPFGELELELKQGTPADLFELAQTLATAAPLRLSFKTKAERGFEAVSGDLPKRVKADPVTLKRRMTSAEAFQGIGVSCLRHLMANEAIVRQVPEADAIRRIASR